MKHLTRLTLVKIAFICFSVCNVVVPTPLKNLSRLLRISSKQLLPFLFKEKCKIVTRHFILPLSVSLTGYLYLFGNIDVYLYDNDPLLEVTAQLNKIERLLAEHAYLSRKEALDAFHSSLDSFHAVTDHRFQTVENPIPFGNGSYKNYFCLLAKMNNQKWNLLRERSNHLSQKIDLLTAQNANQHCTELQEINQEFCE